MGTRSRMCHGGWEVWVHGVSAIICMSKLITVRSIFHIMCVVEIIYIYIYTYTYTLCNTIQKYGFCSYRYRSLLYDYYINIFRNVCSNSQLITAWTPARKIP